MTVSARLTKRAYGAQSQWRARALACVAACAMLVLSLIPDVSTGAESASAPSDDETAAERLLFDTDHLAGVGASTLLEYRYTRSGADAVDDRIVLRLERDDHSLRINPDFLTGDRHIAFPAVDAAHGNPLLLYFLEADLRDMQHQTHGQSDYFRRVIRRALASSSLTVEPDTIELDGHPQAAQRIRFSPYLADPNAVARYPELRDKSYEFVLCDKVPGWIYAMETRVSGTDGTPQIVRAQWASPSAAAQTERKR